MGHTTTTKYQVRLYVPGYNYSPASWNCRRDGRPTGDNLREYVLNFEASTQPGGVNAHLGVNEVESARITLNEYMGATVAEYRRAEKIGSRMFEVVTEYNI